MIKVNALIINGVVYTDNIVSTAASGYDEDRIVSVYTIEVEMYPNGVNAIITRDTYSYNPVFCVSHHGDYTVISRGEEVLNRDKVLLEEAMVRAN